MTRVAVYVRQSVYTDEGIRRQIAKCRELVLERGWTEVATFVDNDTSASNARGVGTKWSKMLQAVEKGDVDLIVAVDMDRLLRRLTDLTALIALGVKIVTVNGEIDLSTADGEFRAAMLASIAAFETKRKSERQKRANAFRASQGLPVLGRRRFGFQIDGVTVDLIEAAWVTNIFERVAGGMSAAAVARMMTTASVPRASFKTDVWTPDAVRKILRNPAYRGHITHLRSSLPSNHIPVIVDLGLATRVDARRQANPRSGMFTSQALLTGVAVCGTCGAHLVSGAGPSNTIYRCSRKQRTAELKGRHPGVSRDIADRVVRHEVVSAFIYGRDDIAALPVPSDLAAIRAKVTKLDERRSNLLALTGGDNDLDLYDVSRQFAQLAKRRRTLMASEQALITSSEYKTLIARVRPTLLDSRTRKRAATEKLRVELTNRFDGLPREIQRTMIRTLLEIAVDPGYGSDRIRVTHLVASQLNDESIPRLSIPRVKPVPQLKIGNRWVTRTVFDAWTAAHQGDRDHLG